MVTPLIIKQVGMCFWRARGPGTLRRLGKTRATAGLVHEIIPYCCRAACATCG